MNLINPTLNDWAEPVSKLGLVGDTLLRKRIEQTRMFVEGAYNDELDLCGEPIWMHPYRVMMRILEVKDITEADLHAALLHDIVEDTEMTLNDLWKIGYPLSTLTIIDNLTRDKAKFYRGKTYLSYMKWLAEFGDFSTRVIKYADLLDNTSPMRQHDSFDNIYNKRYKPAMGIIKQSLPQGVIDVMPSGDLQ